MPSCLSHHAGSANRPLESKIEMEELLDPCQELTLRLRGRRGGLIAHIVRAA